MKIFIRHNRSGEFLGADGTWVSERSQARPFASGYAAVNYCVAKHFQGVHLEYAFPNPAANFLIRLNAGRLTA